DLEPNLTFELERFSEANGIHVTMSVEAKRRFLDFARSPSATWSGNFRDLNAAVCRMATLAEGGRITDEVVDAEIVRLKQAWRPVRNEVAPGHVDALLGEAAEALDYFDRVQLEEVLRICARAGSLSEAGRQLFAQSRLKKKAPNDADRLRKYLARFGLDWERVRAPR
ncbi:MAG: sigma 54-dependent transcriptional regulator, partial [Myxococcales bacterium]